MVETLIARPQFDGPVRHRRPWTIGRVLLWFSIAGVTLPVLGLAAYIVFALAHHAPPSGGGG